MDTPIRAKPLNDERSSECKVLSTVMVNLKQAQLNMEKDTSMCEHNLGDSTILTCVEFSAEEKRPKCMQLLRRSEALI